MLCRIDWLTQKAISTDGSMSTNETTAKTLIFAQSTGSRFGTAVKLARIIPVAHSPVMTRTPSTPIASCERMPVGALVRLHVCPMRRRHGGEDRRQTDGEDD